LCADPKQLAEFLGDLMQVLHLQAKEIERLNAHIEQHTPHLLAASQMPLCVSELSELEARLVRRHDDSHRGSAHHHAEEFALAEQRIPFKDMDPLC
jgi:hypothetical protein